MKILNLFFLLIFTSCFTFEQPDLITVNILDYHKNNIWVTSGEFTIHEVVDSPMNKNCEVSDNKMSNCIIKTYLKKSVNDMYAVLREREIFLKPNTRYIFEVNSYSTTTRAATTLKQSFNYKGGKQTINLIVR